MNVIVRLEEPGDRDASILVEGAAFGSTEEPGIVEAVRDEPGSFALVEAGLAEARSRGESAVILLGSPDLYPRFGFEPASTFGQPG